MSIDEKNLTKGQLRKLTALRKSIGDDLGEEVFAKWLKRQSTLGKAETVDPVAVKIAELLMPLVKDKKARLGRYGYNIRRAKGRNVLSGFVVTKNEKPQ